MRTITIVALLFGVIISFAPNTYAETTSVAKTTTEVRVLSYQIDELKRQLSQLMKQVEVLKKDTLTLSTGPKDVETIQKLLASDPTIYPEGKVTGFMGPLTQEALKRFQKRHGFTEDGALNEETRAKLAQYLKEGKPLAKPDVKAGSIRIKDGSGSQLSCEKDSSTGTYVCRGENKRKTTEEALSLKSAATAALESAEEDIQDAVEIIADSIEDDSNIEYAKKLLRKAEERLDLAQEAFDEEKYLKAKELARAAAKHAKRVEQVLD